MKTKRFKEIGSQYPDAAEQEYLAFVRQRAASVDYQIETKLRSMDEFAEIILTARKSYLSKKINEDIL